MALDHQQLFEKLLEQLQLTELAQQPAFQGAELDKLTVHAQSKRWHFNFKFPDIVPFQTFLTFQGQLEKTFQSIASVDFEIQTPQTQLDNRLVGDYWNWVVQHSGLTSPLVQELCHDQVPQVQDDRVIFMAENEVVKKLLG